MPLHERRIDLAVHSLKDLPTAQPDGMRVVVTGPREDVRDVFVSNVPFQISSAGSVSSRQRITTYSIFAYWNMQFASYCSGSLALSRC